MISEHKLFVFPCRVQFLEKIIFRAASKGRCLQSCVRASSFWQMNVGVLCAKHLVKLQTMRGLWILFIQQRLRWYLECWALMGPFRKCWCTIMLSTPECFHASCTVCRWKSTGYTPLTYSCFFILHGEYFYGDIYIYSVPFKTKKAASRVHEATQMCLISSTFRNVNYKGQRNQI